MEDNTIKDLVSDMLSNIVLGDKTEEEQVPSTGLMSSLPGIRTPTQVQQQDEQEAAPKARDKVKEFILRLSDEAEDTNRLRYSEKDAPEITDVMLDSETLLNRYDTPLYVYARNLRDYSPERSTIKVRNRGDHSERFLDQMYELARQSSEEAALARMEMGITESLPRSAPRMGFDVQGLIDAVNRENALRAGTKPLPSIPEVKTEELDDEEVAILSDTDIDTDDADGGAAPSDGKGLMAKPYDADRMKDINEPLGEGKLSKRSIEELEDFNPIEIQEALEVTADGIIGNQTRKAIGAYQAGIGLPATGFVDRETLKAIRAGKEASNPTNMSFTQESAAGQALSSVEDVYYNPYSLNHQPRLRGNRRHNSGLTIGAGFDLGQKNKQDLLNMGVSEELADKLEKSGWLGLRPSNAVSGEQDSFRTAGHAEMHRLYREQANNGTLLTLTPSEIDELTEAEYNYKQEQIKKKYEDNGYGDWSLVSDEAKIALTVEQYHRGNLGDNWKLFFEKAQQNDVKGITDLYLYSERANPVLRSLGLT